MPDHPPIIKIHLRKVISTLVATAFSLIIMNCLTWYLDRHTDLPIDGWVRLFNVNREANLPTTFSILLLGFSTLLLVIITFQSKMAGEPYVASWLSLSILFGYITIDESSALHEMTNPFLNRIFGSGPSGILTDSWLYLLLILIPIAIIIFARFFFRLPKDTRNWTGIAGIIYILGAAGMEMVGSTVVAAYSANHRLYFIAYTLEESLEMLGIIIFIYALLEYISRTNNVISIKVNKTAAQD